MGETAAWQRGYTISELKDLAEPFRAADEGFIHGAFSAFKERDVAAALEAGEIMALRDGDQIIAAVAAHWPKRRQKILGFDGEPRGIMPPGSLQIRRIGFLPGREEAAIALIAESMQPQAPTYLHIWQESQPMRRIAEILGLQLAAIKIPASSEIIGIYSSKPPPPPYPVEEIWGLQRLSLRIPEADLLAARRALGSLPAWAAHYSSYNRRGSWAALALRGYSDDPAFIAKPAEMSKAWKLEHPELMASKIRDTPLRERLPDLEPLISMIPGEHQRIRLMRLAAGGGELSRHADITDREAGIRPGRIARIHLPLISNPRVTFASWGLDGAATAANMLPGSAWYLDTRKPHTAINGGASERIHLVIDAYSSPELLALLS